MVLFYGCLDKKRVYIEKEMALVRTFLGEFNSIYASFLREKEYLSRECTLGLNPIYEVLKQRLFTNLLDIAFKVSIITNRVRICLLQQHTKSWDSLNGFSL